MSDVTVEMPAELLAELDRQVGPGGRFLDREEAVRVALDAFIERQAGPGEDEAFDGR